MHDSFEDEIINETLMMMKPRIRKNLNKTNYQEREDLEQEINLKVVKAVKNKRVAPIDFWEFVRKNSK